MGTEEEKNGVRKLILLLVGPLVAYLILGIVLDLQYSSTSSEKTKADSSFVSSSSSSAESSKVPGFLSRVASSRASSSSSSAASSRASGFSSSAASSRASSSSPSAESSKASSSSSSADLSKASSSSSGKGGSTVQYDNPITESCDYVLNTNTMKFHYSWCSSARKIKESNRWFFNGSRDDVTAMGYKPCKRCNP